MVITTVVGLAAVQTTHTRSKSRGRFPVFLWPQRYTLSPMLAFCAGRRGDRRLLSNLLQSLHVRKTRPKECWVFLQSTRKFCEKNEEKGSQSLPPPPVFPFAHPPRNWTPLSRAYLNLRSRNEEWQRPLNAGAQAWRRGAYRTRGYKKTGASNTILPSKCRPAS